MWHILCEVKPHKINRAPRGSSCMDESEIVLSVYPREAWWMLDVPDVEDGRQSRPNLSLGRLARLGLEWLVGAFLGRSIPGSHPRCCRSLMVFSNKFQPLTGAGSSKYTTSFIKKCQWGLLPQGMYPSISSGQDTSFGEKVLSFLYGKFIRISFGFDRVQ